MIYLITSKKGFHQYDITNEGNIMLKLQSGMFKILIFSYPHNSSVTSHNINFHKVDN